MSESPTTRKILLASLAALSAAAVALVVAVLPAEYGLDPLGTGEALGLLALSREQPLAHSEGEYRTDSAELVVRPGEWVEYSYRMKEGADLIFSWQASGELETNFHSAPDGAPPGFAESYDSRLASRDDGSYEALFAGLHGWYWENRGEEQVTLLLHTAGFYEFAHEGRHRVSGYHSLTGLDGAEIPPPNR
ncbi:MAG: hypothetical protein VYE73_15260 [Acidobacteriota bacterium]|nr:hypothetical protein [Acidobacteriota bacterium]